MFRRARWWFSVASAGAGSGTQTPKREKIQVVQLPARSLWTKQFPIDVAELKTSSFKSMLNKLETARSFYQYPSMSAPQIGWNVRVFVLSDKSVWVNPELVSHSDMESNDPTHIRKCWAWEPCASCASLMHYIERPFSCRIRALNEHGELVEKDLDKMLARMALHELDHLDGVLFTRRVPDGNHVLPADGFYSMSDWPDDYPSIEGRSTYLYNVFVPPTKIIPDSMPNANLFGRRFEEAIFPGCDEEESLGTAYNEELRRLYQDATKKAPSAVSQKTSEEEGEEE